MRMRKIRLLKKERFYDVDLHIPSGSYQAIIGHTGSGKSTVLQHLNGLLKPSEGAIKIGDVEVSAGKKTISIERCKTKSGHCLSISRTSII